MADQQDDNAIEQALARVAAAVEAHSKALSSLAQRQEALEKSVTRNAENAIRRAGDLSKNQRSSDHRDGTAWEPWE